jgi:hypothetical protein
MVCITLRPIIAIETIHFLLGYEVALISHIQTAKKQNKICDSAAPWEQAQALAV